MIEILKDIPLPSRKPPRFPFAEMEVGDCFQVADIRQSTLCSYARSWRLRNNMTHRKFTVRKLPDGLIGCWRVA